MGCLISDMTTIVISLYVHFYILLATSDKYNCNRRLALDSEIIMFVDFYTFLTLKFEKLFNLFAAHFVFSEDIASSLNFSMEK